MAKIMLVEDDNSLREIYEARLAAEGYTVVSAKDGEEALAMALKERPDLIIADIMMPKVSGFDMLDILRSTPETKNTKIIMMTALSQAEDKARAEKLGADRYLVKSQVTLEDVTREARTILDELESHAAATVASATAPAATPAPASTPAPAPAPAATPAPAAPAPAPEPPTPAPAAPSPVPEPVKPNVTTIPVTAAPSDDTPAVDNPTADVTATDKKLDAAAKALSEPTKKEETEVDEQVDEFIANNPTLSASPEPANAATKAMDSLTTTPDNTPSEDKPAGEAGRNYVTTTSDADAKPPGGSLEHTKRIEPTPTTSDTAKPSLDELMAKEGETLGGDSQPAVNTVIDPSSN